MEGLCDMRLRWIISLRVCYERYQFGFFAEWNAFKLYILLILQVDVCYFIIEHLVMFLAGARPTQSSRAPLIRGAICRQ